MKALTAFRSGRVTLREFARALGLEVWAAHDLSGRRGLRSARAIAPRPRLASKPCSASCPVPASEMGSGARPGKPLGACRTPGIPSPELT